MPSGRPETPPPGPPTGPPPGPDKATGPSSSSTAFAGSPKRPVALIAIGVVVAVIAGFLVANSLGGDGDDVALGSAAGEVFLEAAASVGTDPFFDDFQELVEAPVLAFVSAAAPPPALTNAEILERAFAGKEPGLYGGTGDNAACNTVALVAFLESNPDKAEAWAKVQGIETSSIGDFVNGLTSVQLTQDTRVTNHGFRNGEAYSLQSVLQAGTAVLIDETGVPRVKCGCGNPLKKPIPQTTVVTYNGPTWEGFDPAQVATVEDQGATDTFVLRDMDTGTTINRVAGTNGERDTRSDEPAPTPQLIGAIAAEVVATPTTDPPLAVAPTTLAPTTIALTPIDVTASGTISANSTYDGFPAGLAVDGNEATSWFSTGPGVGDAIYTWSGGSQPISSVTVVGNGGHSNPDFRTGFGFGSVTIEVLSGGSVVFTGSGDLVGTPDPTVTVSPAVVGDTVRLVFNGHESIDCGGFSELRIVSLQ